MHAVRCPACHRVLQIDEDIARAKLRCRNCGKVFIASAPGASAPPPGTGPLPVSSSVAASTAVGTRPHLYHNPAPQRVPKWAVIPLFVVAPLLILVIVLLAVFYGGRPGSESTRPSVAAPPRRAAPTPRGAGPYAQAPPHAGPDAYPDAHGVEPRVVEGDGPAAATRPAAESLHPGKSIDDPGAQIVGLTPHRVDTYWTIILGTAELRNRHASEGVIREVRVVVDAYEGSRLLGSRETKLVYIPAGRGLPLSVRFDGLQADNVTLKARIVALTWAPRDTVCLWIEPDEYIRDDDARTCTLAVSAPNPTGTALKNIRLYCHFANRRGVVQESSTNYVPLEGATVAADGTITFDAARFRASLAHTLDICPRIVAERATAR